MIEWNQENVVKIDVNAIEWGRTQYVEVNVQGTRSYEGGGNTVQCYSLWEMKGLSNISKNDFGEVKMALGESDMTNSLKGLEFDPIGIVSAKIINNQ